MIQMVLTQRIVIKRTVLDIPIVLFFLSQLVSTIVSIDPYISIWGYYGRFNGGLLSVSCYIILYYALVTHMNRTNVMTLIKSMIASAILVGMYGALQRMGVDKHLWVQDVAHRVFSTFGQPNWLAAYLVSLLPVTFALLIVLFPLQRITKKITFVLLFIAGMLFYCVLLFTGSRSGFTAYWPIAVLFWVVIIAKNTAYRKQTILTALAFAVFFGIANAVIKTPYPQINQWLSLNRHQTTPPAVPANPGTQPVAYSESVITDSADIRAIVWQGAIAAWKEKPYFGWGTETFAWTYYKFKPISHNMTSEWDFLYNKAHNEYLNYAATTGSFGLGSYLAVIVVFIIWMLIKLKDAKTQRLKTSSNLPIGKKAKKGFESLDFELPLNLWILSFGFFMGWLSLLITHFFGFSVVVTAVFFWLIPAMTLVIMDNGNKPSVVDIAMQGTPLVNKLSLIFIGIIGVYSLYSIGAIWFSDYYFTKGSMAADDNRYAASYQDLTTAVTLRPSEPLFRSDLSNTLAYLAVNSFASSDATNAAQLTKEAINQSNVAISISPQNLNSWKSRTRMFYTLSQIDESYLTNTLNSITVAQSLAPTDAKISYNTGLMYNANGDTAKAIETLLHTMKLKPNYRDAAYALALFYEEEKKPADAQKWYNYILKEINPNDSEVQKKIVH